jgi:hypothetical protein
MTTSSNISDTIAAINKFISSDLEGITVEYMRHHTAFGNVELRFTDKLTSHYKTILVDEPQIKNVEFIKSYWNGARKEFIEIRAKEYAKSYRSPKTPYSATSISYTDELSTLTTPIFSSAPVWTSTVAPYPKGGSLTEEIAKEAVMAYRGKREEELKAEEERLQLAAKELEKTAKKAVLAKKKKYKEVKDFGIF